MKKSLLLKFILLFIALSGSAYAQLSAVISSSNNVTCFGGSDGAATVTASAGSPPYSYSWSFGPTTQTVSGLAAGIYTVTVTDAISATATATVTINQPTMISANAGLDGTICQGNMYSITGNVTGGVPAYTYNWTPSTGLSSTTVANPSASPISTTAYTLTVIDANGCTANDAIIVTVNPLPTITANASPSSICSGASSTLTATGATTYIWNTGATTSSTVVSPSVSTSYTVTGTSATGCTNSATQIVTVLAPLNITFSGINVTCNGLCDGSINATVNGGTGPYTFNWSPTGGTTPAATALCAGNYTLNVTDAAGCTAMNNYTILEPSLLNVTANSVSINCAGMCDGQTTVMASGGTPGYTYSWAPGGSTLDNVTGLCPGTYTVTVTDVNGCTNSANTTITQPPTLIITPSSTNITCNGNNDGTAGIVTAGGVQPYMYNWSNGSNTPNITNLSAGSYTVNVVDANGCTVSNPFVITSPPALTNSFSTTIPSCGISNGSIAANTIGGIAPYVFHWSNGNTTSTISNLNPGVYMLDIVDNNGCLLSQVEAIGTSAGPTVTQTSFSNITCNGADDGMISVSISGGTLPYTVFWTDMDSSYITQTRTNMQAGPYEFIVADANGCQTVFTSYINEPAPINVGFNYSLPSSCISGDGVINANVTGGTGAYSFVWSNATTTPSISSLTAGVYTLTVTDANGCTHVSEAFLSDNTSLDATGTSVVTNCGTNTGSIDITPLNGSGSYSYAWSNGASSEDISSLYPGHYGVTVTDDVSGCRKALDFIVESTTAMYAPQVCMVTVDTLDEKNIIIWERPTIGGIKEFVIYRETSQAGIYRYIGTNPIDSLTEMKDTVADADLHAWKYKISAIDSCNIETGVSEVEHRPIFLTVDTTNGLPSLVWTAYMGRPFSAYTVKRNANGTGWVDVVTLPATQNSYVDVNCPSGIIEYTIEALFTSTCEATRGAINTTRSNIKTPTSVIVGLKGNTTIENNVSLFPNPSQDNFTISLTNKVKENINIEVLNALGQVVYTTTINESNKATTIAATNWNNGIYFVRINSTEMHSVIKFVKQ